MAVVELDGEMEYEGQEAIGGGISGDIGPFHYNSYGGAGGSQTSGFAFGTGGNNGWAGGGGGLFGGQPRK